MPAPNDKVQNASTLNLFPNIRAAIDDATIPSTIEIGQGTFNITNSDTAFGTPSNPGSAPPTFGRAKTTGLEFLGAGIANTNITGDASIYVDQNDGDPIPTGMLLDGMTLSYTNGSGYILAAGYDNPSLSRQLTNLTLSNLLFTGTHTGQAGANGNYINLVGADRLRIDGVSTNGLTGQSGFISGTTPPPNPLTGTGAGTGGSAFLQCKFGTDLRVENSQFYEKGYSTSLIFSDVSSYYFGFNSFYGGEAGLGIRNFTSPGRVARRGEVIERSSGQFLGNNFYDGAYVDVRGLRSLDGLNTITGNSFIPSTGSSLTPKGAWGILVRNQTTIAIARDNLRIAGNTFKDVIPVVSFITTSATASNQLTFTGNNFIYNPALNANETFGRLIVGGLSSDVLTGATGTRNTRDFITGDLGNDTLTGNGGADAFVFTTPLNASDNVDRITDFSNGTGGDKIWLDDAIFTALTPGTPPNFTNGGAGGNVGTANIIYNSSNGNLFYDPNGGDPTDRVLFARLTGAPTLSQNSFVVF